MIVFPATNRSQGCRGREVLADEGGRAREQSPGPGRPTRWNCSSQSQPCCGFLTTHFTSNKLCQYADNTNVHKSLTFFFFLFQQKRLNSC